MSTIGQSEFERWRLILLDGQRRELQVIANAGAATLALPEVEIPQGQRAAEALTKAVSSLWKLSTVCLCVPSSLEPNAPRYAVMETLSAPSTQSNLRAIAVHEVLATSFQNPEQFLALQQCLAELNDHAPDPAAPFTKQGWFQELQMWIGDSLRPVGLQLTGNFQQLNGSPSFSLIRFETTGPDVWFKAVGEPNLREFPITLELSRCFPKYLPRIIGKCPQWNGWIALSAGSTSLSETNDLTHWEATVRALANLQIESIENAEVLLKAGAHDLRSHKLSALVQPFLDVVSRLMRDQTKASPSPLSDEELGLLGLRLQDAITLLEELGIPHALGHLDLNPGNIIPSDGRCKFLDWAEAYIGHPFFSFEYLAEHRRRAAGSTELESSVLTAYVQPWTRIVSREVITEAFPLIPLVAVFAYAAGSQAWRKNETLCDPNVSGYFRALARRMNREAVQLLDRRAPCLN